MSAHSPPKGSAPGGKNGYVPIFDIRPSPENEQLYRPVDPNDPDILALAESIERDGILEPLVAIETALLSQGIAGMLVPKSPDSERFHAVKSISRETVPNFSSCYASTIGNGLKAGMKYFARK